MSDRIKNLLTLLLLGLVTTVYFYFKGLQEPAHQLFWFLNSLFVFFVISSVAVYKNIKSFFISFAIYCVLTVATEFAFFGVSDSMIFVVPGVFVGTLIPSIIMLLFFKLTNKYNNSHIESNEGWGNQFIKILRLSMLLSTLYLFIKLTMSLLEGIFKSFV